MRPLRQVLFLLILAWTFTATAALTPADREFLNSLGLRYRIGTEIEVTRHELAKVARFYSVPYYENFSDVEAMLRKPGHAKLRDDVPEGVRKTLKNFRTESESGLPDIEFILRDDLPDVIKRDPVFVLNLQSQLIDLLGVKDTLNDPLGPYAGISIHNHISRVDEQGEPDNFPMERVLAHFDYKAAYIYFHRAEDMFKTRGLSIFFKKVYSAGFGSPRTIRQIAMPSGYGTFENRTLIDQSVITNLRGQHIDMQRVQMARKSLANPESLPESDWIEDKGRIFTPDEQLVWTLKVLEGKITLSELYNDIAKMILDPDFLTHIFHILHQDSSRQGLAIGLVVRTARHSAYRDDLVRKTARALATTAKRFPSWKENIVRNFLASFSSTEDRAVIRDIFNLAVKESPDLAICATALSP